MSKRVLTGNSSFVIGVDTSGLDSLIDQLDAGAEEAARPAAQAGAQVLYDEVKKNVAAIGKKTGNLDRSIYQAFSASNSGPGKAVYQVSWNHKKAPHGWLVENGYLQRYEMAVDDSGKFLGPRVRPGMEGKPRPRRRSSQAQKDAYWVTLPTPIQVPAKAFVRRAQSAFDRAYAAAAAELLRRLESQWYGGA
jgi:hypothetical protein